MHLQLIEDYIEDTNTFTYPDFKITDIEVKSGEVYYTENSGCGYYHEHCTICMLDLLAWVYSKTV